MLLVLSIPVARFLSLANSLHIFAESHSTVFSTVEVSNPTIFRQYVISPLAKTVVWTQNYWSCHELLRTSNGCKLSRRYESFPTSKTPLQVDCWETDANLSTTHLVKPAGFVVCLICVVIFCVFNNLIINRYTGITLMDVTWSVHCRVDCNWTTANPAATHSHKHTKCFCWICGAADCCVSTKFAIN